MSTQRAAKTHDVAAAATGRRSADKARTATDSPFADSDESLEDFEPHHIAADGDDADGLDDDEGDDEDDDDLDGDASGDFAELSGDTDDAGPKLFREDPVLDRRIIEGMLKDRNSCLEEMAKEGFGQAAVLRRAAELGLSEALIRQVKGVAADLAGERPGRRPAPSSLGARTCLSCDRVFLSSGPGNRLCMRCRGGDAGLAQL